MNHMREAALTDEDGFPFDFDQELPIMDPLSPETQCQFILKRNRKIPNRIAIGKLVCFRLKQRSVDRSSVFGAFIVRRKVKTNHFI